MGLWTLVPDKFEDDEHPKAKYGAFLTTLLVFFLVEMGDKTPLATVALGAKYQNVLLVTTGTTLGMMIANVPAVVFGDRICKLIPLKIVRTCAALMFIILGTLMLVNIS
jgi:putative Ca2+/H+ antiporter (TMEM165/GDT1 family)